MIRIVYFLKNVMYFAFCLLRIVNKNPQFIRDQISQSAK